MASATLEVPGVEELSDDRAMQLFDQRARVLVGLSGDEFVARWRTGDFVDTDDENIMHMIMLLPLVLDVPTTSPASERSGPATRVGATLDEFLGKLRRGVSRRWQERIHTKP